MTLLCQSQTQERIWICDLWAFCESCPNWSQSDCRFNLSSLSTRAVAKLTLCETRARRHLSLSVIAFVLRSAEFLSEPDEKAFRPADVAEPIRVFILDYFAYELCAALEEPFKRLVDVVHGEHDAEVA